MKRSLVITGGVIGFLTSLVIIAVSFLGNYLFNLPFLPFDLFEGVTRPLPAVIIETAIRINVSVITALHLGPTDTTAKLAEQLQGLALIVGTGIVFGLILSWIGLARKAWLGRGALAGGLVLSIGIAIVEFTISPASWITWLGLIWLIVLIAGWSWWLYRIMKDLLPLIENPVPQKKFLAQAMSEAMTRRNFLTVAWSSLVSLIVVLVGLGKIRPGATPLSNPVTGAAQTPAPVPVINLPFGPQYTSGPAASPAADVLAARLAAAPGARAEVTPADQFYRIDIDLVPPQIDASSWSMNVKGLVQNPTSFSLADLVAFPAQSQGITIGCISNTVGGSLISGNYWTGVPLKTILDKVGLQTGANAVSITSADGFYEALNLTEAMDERTLLVYAMNGKALTAEHGYPLRIYIPDHYGMKQPKWITQMEVTGGLGPGYWVDRGWSQTAIPQTLSMIDTRSVDQAALAKDGVFPLGGIAWAGARMIQKVELQFNDAPWVEAQLVNPPFSPLTWVEWRYDWKPTPGSYQVKVRATDGSGNLQDPTSRDPLPEGATGLDTASFKI